MVQQISMSPALQATHANQNAEPAEQKTDGFQSVLEKTVSQKKSARKTDGKTEDGNVQKGAQPQTLPADNAMLSAALNAVVQNGGAAQAVQPEAQIAPQGLQAAIGPVFSVQTAVQTLTQPLGAAVPASPRENGEQTVRTEGNLLPAARTEAEQTAPAAGESPILPQRAVPSAQGNAEPQKQATVSTQPGSPLSAEEAALPENPPAAVQTTTQAGKSDMPSPVRHTAAVQTAQAEEAPPLPGISKAETASDGASQSGSYRQLLQTGNVVIQVSAPPPAAAKAVPHQIADQIAFHYKAGNPQFEMQLYPKNLGRVTVKLGVEQGTLRVEISAADPKTQSMLLSGSGEIRSVIEAAVHKPVQVQQLVQDAVWRRQQDSEGRGGQQQRQSENDRRQDRREPASTADFVALMQQLRVRDYSA